MPTSVRSRLARSPRRRGLRWHRLRALRHHTVALLREFRGPLAAFAVITVLGGILYGELYQVARPGTHIPVIDRPYLMLQLMLLETPEPVPPEWYLVAFWYLLPVAFVVILGLGAADFVDLFFNRDDDRDAWGEALAMTYRDHAIVCGAGHVGLRVVRDLLDLGMEVVVIDNAPDPEARIALDRMQVPVVMGDGRHTATLGKARLQDAEVFVACTADDQVNLETVMAVRDLNDGVRVVTRIWDRAYARRLQKVLGVDAVLSAADLSAPAFAGAAVGIDITQTLDIAGEEYSTARLRVQRGGALDGATVGMLQQEGPMDVTLRCRGAETALNPGPEEVLRPGDEVVVFARHRTVLEVVASNRPRALAGRR